jgi:large subunit ribosomal protein L24
MAQLPEIRKGDTVVVLGGKDAGKQGVVDHVIRREPSRSPLRSVYRHGSPKGGVSVVIEGINVGKRHQKPRQTSSQTDRMPKIQQGGILDVAMPLAVSKVMLVCPKCHRPTRVAHSVLDDGRRVRTCKHCGAALEVVK